MRFNKVMGACLCFIAVCSGAVGQITGSGTTNQVAKFTGTGSIGNSAITESNGNVGINTTSPAAPLTVVGPSLGTSSGNTANLLSLNNTDGNQSFLNIFQLRSWSGVDWTSSTTRIRQIIDSTGMGYIDFNPPNGSFGIAFGSGVCCNTSIASEYMRIAQGGNVGIGTTSPSTKLEVNGQITLTPSSGGGITFADSSVQTTAWTGALCGGDYAESIDVSGDRIHYQPGDVLVIDDQHAGKFLKSSEPYSQGIAGVYSTKPGLIGRRQTVPKSADEVPMGVIGILPVKVTAENGAIHPRDILVSSSLPGYAMKGTDRGKLIGAVIGKALGTLEVGTGVIEVLVNVQ